MSKDVTVKAPDGFKSLNDLRVCIALDELRDRAAIGFGLKPARSSKEPHGR